MGWKRTLGTVAGGVGGFLLGGPAGAAAGASLGGAAGGGLEEQGKADDYQKRALAQSEREYDSRAPLRRQGMQALGQIEAPMDLGNLGYNASNPFAAARGPAPSTASYGDWGRMTTSPEAVDQALSGVSPQQLADAEAAMAAQPIGRSNGAQRFNSGPGTREYTNKDRERALQVLGQYDRSVGFARPRQSTTGIQPLGGGR